MASSSNPPDDLARIQDYEYLYASDTNVSNFVSVKLSGHSNYHRWKTQMLCLMEAHEMCWLVDDRPKDLTAKIMKKYDSLLKGWILGSVRDDVIDIVVDLASAKDVWMKLKSCFDSTMSTKQDSAPTKAKKEIKETKVEDAEIQTNNLQQLIADRDWDAVYKELKERNALTEKIIGDGSTLLHIVVRIGRNDLVTRILECINDDDLTEMTNSDGSTPLHIAGTADNVLAAELLIKKNSDLWYIKDNEGETPRDKVPRNIKSTYMHPLLLEPDYAGQNLQRLIVDGDWYGIYETLKVRNKLSKKISSDGSTLLHIAVGMGLNDLIIKILMHTQHDDLNKNQLSDGSTVLHTAAIVGNTYAAKLLVKKNKKLLRIPDNKGQTPLYKAYQNMHLDTIAYLLEATEADKKSMKDGYVDETNSTLLPSVGIGVDLLVNAISARQYHFSAKLIDRNPEYAVSNDNVLMALARTFPSGLDYGERFIYPSLDNICETLFKRTKRLFILLIETFSEVIETMWSIIRCEDGLWNSVLKAILGFLLIVPVTMVYWIYHFVTLLLLMVYFPFSMLYSLLVWKVAARVVPLAKNIVRKKKEYEDAKTILYMVLKTINEKRHHKISNLYTEPILEAACQDAYEVAYQILRRWPEAIRCKDKNGYDIIQLATIHRSERIYNLINTIGKRKNIYRTIQDSSKNNMLHLVGRLAPSNKLKRRTGAALQLQRELQWRQEVEKLVFPAYITKENIFMETPEMVFTKEHENLVKEGETWIKTVAESCSITAALITTIVFAAAITVPGGSNQDTGIPVFTEEAAFTIFAIADAISLFSSATALLVFLSILTARFAEQDFLLRLPRRLIIGLCTLLISATAMMVAFSATLFLVFSRQKKWVLAPICALALLPIAFFFVLQFPLILDLVWSTYIFKFGKNDIKSGKSTHNNIRFFFSN